MLSNVHHKGVSITGAFEWLPPFHDAKAGWGPSLEMTVHTVMNWIRSGRLRTAGMVSQIASPQNCQEVFRQLASDRNSQFGVVFDWRRS
jgi:threonine dehydrogenase-like Zn-dependent dehydrogenase